MKKVHPGVEMNGTTLSNFFNYPAVMWRIHVRETLIGLILENNTGSVIIYQDKRRQKNFILCYYSVVNSTKDTSGLYLSGCFCAVLSSLWIIGRLFLVSSTQTAQRAFLSLAKTERKYLTATYSEANQTGSERCVSSTGLDNHIRRSTSNPRHLFH